MNSDEANTLTCLSCGSIGLHLTEKLIHFDLDGYEFWMPSKCWGCKICDNEIMDSDQMQQFRNKYNAVKQERLLQEKAV